MFKLFYGGGEVPTWRKALRQAGATGLAVNFTHLLARLPKHKEFNFDTFAGFDVLVYTSPKELSPEDAEAYARRYEQFVTANAANISVLVEPDIEILAGRRDEWADLLPDRFFAMWDGEESLTDLCVNYHAVAVATSLLEASQTSKQLVATADKRFGARTLALGLSRPGLLEHSKFDMAITSAWLSASKYGETTIWDGATLHRYPAKSKSEVRRRYRSVAQQAGVSEDDLLGDDPDAEKAAATQLALWSWGQFEASVNKRRQGTVLPFVKPSGDPIDELWARSTGYNQENGNGADRENHPAGTVITESEGGNLRVAMPPTLRDTVTLPVMALQHDEEPLAGADPQPPVMALSSSSMRQCDTCFLSAHCPRAEPRAACAYDIPVEIKTAPQLTAALQAMLEMQAQRVMFVRFAEELQGGYPDPNLSAELDRFLRMVSTTREIQDNRDTLHLELKAKAGAGALSRIFGAHVGEANHQALPQGGLGADATDALLSRASEVIDVDPL